MKDLYRLQEETLYYYMGWRKQYSYRKNLFQKTYENKENR